MAQDLKDTLQLPKTDFPMRANLVQREPSRLAHWEKLDLYAAIQRKNAATGKTFVLHDGPPFTNGDVHIGTALNKTLKDITLRHKSMRGFRTPYVPGWDCHGLPIEQKVMRQLQAENKQVSTAEMRTLCDTFSEGWIATQTRQFKRLGVLADWNSEYKTKNPAYEADIIRTFSAFVGNNLVYRSKKPVYWSIPFETALAEAEIEYKDHTSIAIWVKFAVPLTEAEKFGLPTDKPISFVIWTTTPWTIPANLAIAVNPDIEYEIVGSETERFFVAHTLATEFQEKTKLVLVDGNNFRSGKQLEGIQARHPFIDRASPVVLADYVTTDSGTGAVHTAPGHGADDYLTGLKYKLEIYCPVGADGRYLDDGQVPPDLVGLSTLETVEDIAAKKPSPANLAVLKKLAGAGALLAKAKYVHSYPHCWRSKTPIIFRAVDQWFVGLDRKAASSATSPRETALKSIAGVQWVPTWGEARIRGAVEARPDWCISRQRSWGVPIIAFYDADKTAFIDAGVIRAVADKIATKGTNFWYDAPAAEILAGIALPAGWPAAVALTPGRDTLDVWIDSGSSHAAVLKNHQGATQWPADLYLEGSDQHRGWFQSSLWTGVIAQGGAPYKAVLTHGFIVGEDGKKISKSGQYEKPPTSDNFIAQYGADVIRFWIASQDFTQDITLSEKILNNAAEGYRNLRNTLRYQLSTLWDFNPATDALPYAQLDTLDRWALHQTAKLLAEATVAYDAYEYHRVIQAVSSFCATTLSAVYHDILKDRLYTLGTTNPLRRSSQTAIHHIFGILVKILAPVLTFTADEAWAYATTKTEFSADSIHLQDWPEADAAWTNAEIEADVAALIKVRSKVNEAIEPLRAAGKLGKSLDAVITLSVAPADPLFKTLEKHRDFLPELFIVSHVTLQEGANPAFEVTVRHGEELGYVRCPRCWRWVPALETTEHGETCPRCAEALRT
ncbi:MAG: isoleucine--tRNA ligase [Verrucomicrobia bacterium]|nr:isoleucine--tRNA ligase [Verrucomicrobiota bacterium]